ncbi:MAG: TIGR03960 family B12-binding radical SAM protein [Planctomycetota bacterium]
MSKKTAGQENLWDAMGKVDFRAPHADEAAPGEDLMRLPDGAHMEGHPYLAFLHRLEKPGRYAGGELQSVRKTAADISIALAFPDTYEIGMSHLGYRILYSHLNDMSGVRAERVYAPWPDLEQELRQRGLPLVSLESWTPLREFDCVGFSLQYELTFTNILTMLDTGGIALRSVDRDEDAPLILAGGPVAFQPEPMAPFIDAFLFGDGERYFAETVATWVRLRDLGLPRRERLRRLAQLDGIYVPSLYRTAIDPRSSLEVVMEPLAPGVPTKIGRAHVPDINEYPWPNRAPVPNTEVVFDRASIEIARGCTEGCRFCQAGMIYRPVRERSPEQILGAVRNAVKCGGFNEVGLTSLSTADYSAIQPLVHKIMAELPEGKTSLSVSSLRAYGLSEQLLDDISSVRNTSLTFAPEAGTQRMRDVVNKNVTEEHIQTSAHRIFQRGWRKMKCYFMIGLPTETDEDVLGIVETGKRLLDIGKHYPQRARIEVTLSVSSHVPKPFTPFQWAAMDDIPQIERKHELLKVATRTKGLKLRWHSPDSSHLEGIIARGDRRIADVIETAWRKGCRFDSWADHLRFDLWMETIAECGIDRYAYLSTLPVDGRLPWDHIDCGVEMEFLAKEYRKALKDRLSPPCGKPFPELLHHTSIEDAQEDQRKLVCYHCGVTCDMKQMRDERIEYLQTLDAHRVGEATERVGPSTPAAGPQRGVPASAPAVPTAPLTPSTLADGETRPKKGKPRPPRRAYADQVKYTYRFRYAKFGALRFVSHLDMLRLLPRAFQRAGIELGYSQGFHPVPLLSFGPPIRLGVAALSEPLEVKLAEHLPVEEILRRVNAVLPTGVLLREGVWVEDGAPKMSRECMWADYLIFVPRAATSEPEALLASLRSGGELRLSRSRKDGSVRSVDIRPGVGSVAWLAEVPADAREFLRLDGAEDLLLQACLGLQGTELVRPEELLIALFGGKLPANARVVRRCLLGSPREAAWERAAVGA